MRQDQSKQLAHSIAYVVKSFQNRVGDYDPKLFERYCNIAIEQYGEFNLYHLPDVDVVYIDLNDALVGNLPPNFAYYTKVGIPLAGNVWTLTVNRNLIKPPSNAVFNNINKAIGAAKTDVAGYTFVDHYHGGALVSGMFAMGGGFNRSYFNIDETKGIVWLTDNVPSRQVILEYVTNGLDRRPTTLIASYAVQPLRSYLEYHYHENILKSPEGTIRRKLYQYEKDAENMRLLANKFTLSEYLDSMYSTYQQGPKR